MAEGGGVESAQLRRIDRASPYLPNPSSTRIELAKPTQHKSTTEVNFSTSYAIGKDNNTEKTGNSEIDRKDRT
jgi:hypothetical protein